MEIQKDITNLIDGISIKAETEELLVLVEKNIDNLR
jgi:hypothetical protein